MNCKDCYYYGFNGLIWWCYEPETNRKLKRITAKWKKFQSATKKVMPNEKGEYDYGYPGRLER